VIPARVRRSLGAQLLIGQMLVVLAGATTLLLTALSIGPTIFHHHVKDALGSVPADVARHLDEAFGESTLIALGAATGAAIVTALAVSWLVSRRVVHPIRRLAASAGRIARGAYSERVPAGGEDELAALAAAFNAMAGSLEASEHRRRRLLSDVAHELRTPLATVDAHLEGLADGVLPPDADTLATIRHETARLGRLVDDLQAVSRAEERQLQLELRDVAPAQLLHAAARAAEPATIARGVTITTTADRRLAAVAVDEDRFAEALTNLVDNALRHTPAGGTIALSAHASGDEVHLAVSDTGSGIAPAYLDRIFERFFRADTARSRADGGSGIGLTITRAIVDAHGGRITARSAGPGTGATFTISLPARGQSAPNPER
jgi:two-component system sensor histidine kinase BaeS